VLCSDRSHRIYRSKRQQRPGQGHTGVVHADIHQLHQLNKSLTLVVLSRVERGRHHSWQHVLTVVLNLCHVVAQMLLISVTRHSLNMSEQLDDKPPIREKGDSLQLNVVDTTYYAQNCAQ